MSYHQQSRPLHLCGLKNKEISIVFGCLFLQREHMRRQQCAECSSMLQCCSILVCKLMPAGSREACTA